MSLYFQPRDYTEKCDMLHYKYANLYLQQVCLGFLKTAMEHFQHSVAKEDDTACQSWLDKVKGVVSSISSIDIDTLSPLSCKFCELVSLVATVRTCVRAGGLLSSEEFASIMSSLNSLGDHEEFKTEKLKKDIQDLKDKLGVIMVPEGNPEETLQDFLKDLFEVASEAVSSILMPQSISFETVVILKPVASSTSAVPLVKSSCNEDINAPVDNEFVHMNKLFERRSRTSPLPQNVSSTSSDKSEDFQPSPKQMPPSAFRFGKPT